MEQYIHQISTKLLKPDPKQPRQHIDQEKVNQLSVSVKKKGVINPIEIDKDNVIITGEMRWRAATKAGLATVPCKILDITGDERFMRQMHENVHHNTMSVWDTAMAVKRVSKILFPDGNINKSKLAAEFGKNVRWARDLLEISNANRDIIQVAKKVTDYSLMREIRSSVDKYRPYIAKLVTVTKLPRPVVVMVRKAINKAYYEGNHEAIDRILSADFKGKNQVEVHSIISSIMPDPLRSIEEVQRELQNTVQKLVVLLEKNPPAMFGTAYVINILPFLVALMESSLGHMRKARETYQADQIGIDWEEVKRIANGKKD